MKNRVVITLVIITGIIGIAASIGLFSHKYYQAQNLEQNLIQGLLWPDPKQITVFETIDNTNNRFGLEQLLGKWSFIFFGYTHCPDVCPVTLSVLNSVYKDLQNKGKAEDLQTIFVSVDPERDTPDQLDEYVRYFNPDFIGLGGTQDQVNSIIEQLGIAYFYGNKNDSGEYDVDHTASVFLIDPKGRLIGVFSSPQEKKDLINRFLAMQNFIEGQS